VNNVLIAIAVLLIASLAALFAVPHVVDWNKYRGVFEEEISRVSGRDVRVGGAVSFRLLPTPSFRIEKIRIADREATSGDAFFRAEAITARLSVAPLLRGILEANELELTQPQMHLVLDGKGGGNWRALAPTDLGQIPFLPNDVAFQAVRIVDGSFSIEGPDRVARLQMTAIEGEFSAPALEGPYRFRGTYGDKAARRDLRLQTNKPDADGSIRFKAGLKHVETGSVYNLDARAIDLGGKPRLEGELAAQVVLPHASNAQAAAPTKPPIKSNDPKATPSAADAPIEIKAALTADLQLVKLANLTISFEQQGRPQAVSGDAEIELGGPGAVKATLAARWLDLDNIVASGTAVHDNPLSALFSFASRLNGLAPRRAAFGLSLAVEQANLGREAVSGLVLRITGRNGATDIQELRLGLPGGARADLRGSFAGQSDAAKFDGEAVVRGTSLGRFLGWASANSLALDPARDGPFALRGNLAVQAGSLYARDFVGELAGTTAQGEVGYRWLGRRELSILVEGPQIDLRPLLSETDTPASSAGAPTALLKALAAGTVLGIKPGDLDAVLRLRTGQLLIPGGAYQDVNANIELRDRKMRIAQLQLSGDHGITLDVDGELTSLDTKPKGTLRGIISADTPEGLDALASLLSWPADLLPAVAKRSSLLPARLAGTAQFNPNNATGLDLAIDGTLAASHLRAKARLANGLDNWRTAPLDITASLTGPAVDTQVLALTGRTTGTATALPRQPASPTAASAQTLTIKSAGKLADGLATVMRLDGQAAATSFNGRITSLEPITLNGQIKVKATDSRHLNLLLAGIADVTASRADIDASADIDIAAKATQIERIDARIGGAQIAGALTVAAAELPGRHHLSGRLDLGSLSVAAILQPVLDRRAVSAAAAEISAATSLINNAATIWPVAAFDFTPLATLEGAIAVSAKRLQLADGVGLEQVRFTLGLAPDRLEFRDLEGTAAGGRWAGSFKLDRTSNGADFAGVLRTSGARFEQVLASTPPRASGAFNGLLTVSGRGSSIRDLISTLSGRGNLDVASLQASALTPQAVTAALDLALRGPADNLASILRQQLQTAYAAPVPVQFPPQQIKLEMANGVLTSTPLSRGSSAGRVETSLKFDLTALAATGEWRVDNLPPIAPLPAWAPTVTAAPGAPPLPPPAPVAPPKAVPPLPPIVLSFISPLGAAMTASGKLDTETFARELAVRKMERDVEELERLRRMDEERARLDIDRRQQQDNALQTGQPTAVGPIGATPADVKPTETAPIEAAVKPEQPPDPNVAPAPRPRPAAKPVNRPFKIEDQRF
jgi:uncharacterized protein involved in outer membrane biogenesis